MAKASLGVDLDQHVAELGIPDHVEHALACLGDLRFDFQRLNRGNVDMPLAVYGQSPVFDGPRQLTDAGFDPSQHAL